MGAEATLNPAQLSVTPGGEAHTEISVTNNGHVVDEFTLRVLGDAAAWTFCDPPGISLLPGHSGSARIVFRPPPGPELRSGPLPFAIRVSSVEDATRSVVEEGLLDVGEMPQLAVDLSPRTGRARGLRASRHRIAVDNYGNAPALVSLIGADEADTAEVSIRPTEVEVGPGAAVLADVRVRGRHRFWRGHAVTHRFSVTAVAPGGQPFRTEGSLLQEAALPGWLPKVVALVAAGAIALAALWFAVLRPVVRSAAANAGAAAAKQAVHQALQNSPAGSGAGAANGGGSAMASASPSPTPTPPSKPAHAAPAPVPFSESLSLADPSITSPAKRQLAITDLVMQNPAGDQGMLTISRNGQALFSLGLADFRIYDPHFITPIIVPTGQSITISVKCTNPGGKACTPSVLISGTREAS